jgi:hypothetical protein
MVRTRVKKRGRPSTSGTTEPSASPMSLPPSGTDSAAAIPISEATPESDTQALADTPAKKPFWVRDKTSKAYEQAMKIFAMRAAGIPDKEIAASLKINDQSLWNICYIAGKNGWVSDQLARAKDVVEFQIMPKVLRELELGLGDSHRNEKTGMQVKTLVALRVAENTVFKTFEQTGGGIVAQNVIAIRIETLPGPPQVMREGTIGGVPAYQDAEVVDVGEREQSGVVQPVGGRE